MLYVDDLRALKLSGPLASFRDQLVSIIIALETQEEASADTAAAEEAAAAPASGE